MTIEPFDFQVRLATDGGVDQAVDMLMRIGPTGSALAEADDDARQAAPALLKAALAPHARDGAVSLGGAIWLADAAKPH